MKEKDPKKDKRQEVIAKRRESVLEGMLAGMFNTDLAKQLGVTRRTISTDIVAIRTQLTAELAKVSAQDIITEYLMQQKRAMQDLTALQERTHNDNVRLGCITRKADIVNHMIEKLQVLGIIETSPEKLDIRLEDLRLQDVARMFKKYEKKGA